jgi:hypothetical protein
MWLRRTTSALRPMRRFPHASIEHAPLRAANRRVTWINIQQHRVAYALWYERTQEPRILAQLCSENAQHGRTYERP